MALELSPCLLQCGTSNTAAQLPGVSETTNAYTTQNHKDFGSFKVTCLDQVKIDISNENDPHMDIIVRVDSKLRKIDLSNEVSLPGQAHLWHKIILLITSGIARNFPGGGGLHVDTTLENANFFIASPRPPYSYTTAYNINE